MSAFTALGLVRKPVQKVHCSRPKKIPRKSREVFFTAKPGNKLNDLGYNSKRESTPPPGLTASQLYTWKLFMLAAAAAYVYQPAG